MEGRHPWRACRLLPRTKKKFGPVWAIRKLNCFPPTGFSSTRPVPRLIWAPSAKAMPWTGRPPCLRAHGISRALLDAGGSTLVALGTPPGQAGWPVHLKDPSNRVDPVVMLSDSSVSTSEQTPPSLLSPEQAGHIIDPDSGAPERTPFAVSVVARTGTASDALSTTLLLVGPEKGKELVKTMAGVAAIWISADGTVGVGIQRPQDSDQRWRAAPGHQRPDQTPAACDDGTRESSCSCEPEF